LSVFLDDGSESNWAKPRREKKEEHAASRAPKVKRDKTKKGVKKNRNNENGSPDGNWGGKDKETLEGGGRKNVSGRGNYNEIAPR